MGKEFLGYFNNLIKNSQNFHFKKSLVVKNNFINIFKILLDNTFYFRINKFLTMIKLFVI